MKYFQFYNLYFAGATPDPRYFKTTPQKKTLVDNVNMHKYLLANHDKIISLTTPKWRHNVKIHISTQIKTRKCEMSETPNNNPINQNPYLKNHLEQT